MKISRKKIQSIIEKLMEVRILRQEKESSMEELKKKDEEIKRLCKHNKDLLNDVKNVKRRLQESKSKNKDEYFSIKVEEDTTKRLEKEICKKVEEP
jgi:hypothetical protein